MKTIPYLKYKVMKKYTFGYAIKEMKKGKIFFCEDENENFFCFYKYKKNWLYSAEYCSIKEKIIWNKSTSLINDQNLTDLKEANFYKASMTINILLSQGV